MTDATTTKAKTKTAAAPLVPEVAKFEIPRFEMPKFDVPKMEVPAAFREFAEKGVAQAKENYERMKAVAEDTSNVLETTYATVSKGSADYGLKMLEIARLNTNAAFDFAEELFGVKSYSEVVELTATHARKQFETFSAQAKELTELAQKVATDSAEPMKSGFSKAMKKVA
jgi:phasin